MPRGLFGSSKPDRARNHARASSGSRLPFEDAAESSNAARGYPDDVAAATTASAASARSSSDSALHTPTPRPETSAYSASHKGAYEDIESLSFATLITSGQSPETCRTSLSSLPGSFPPTASRSSEQTCKAFRFSAHTLARSRGEAITMAEAACADARGWVIVAVSVDL